MLPTCFLQLHLDFIYGFSLFDSGNAQWAREKNTVNETVKAQYSVVFGLWYEMFKWSN